MKRSDMLKDMQMSLDVTKETAINIVDYLETHWIEELCDHNECRLGDIGKLLLKSNKRSVTVVFQPFKRFMKLFRKKYKIVHMIETE